MEDFERQGRNILGGNQNFLDQARGELIIVTQK